jgi:hypothetical protein
MAEHVTQFAKLQGTHGYETSVKLTNIFVPLQSAHGPPITGK